MSSRRTSRPGGPARAQQRGPERARRVAAERLAAQRRRQRLVVAGVTAAVVLLLLVIGGGVGYTVYQRQQQSAARSEAGNPAGATATAVLVGKADAPVTVDIYLDYQCPVCKQFEAAAGSTLDAQVRSGAIRIAYHPVAYLDRFSSGTRYSSRASSASGCAADASVYERFTDALFADQPAENGSGLSDDRLIEIGRDVGATGSSFADCVRSERYRAWTAGLTEAASKAGVNGTPTVRVDGKAVGPAGGVPSPDQVEAAIEAAG